MAKAIHVSSGYGVNTKEPFVEIHFTEPRVQMSPENARDLALNLLQAAESAYSDAFLVEFMTDAVEESEAAAAGLLIEFRKWREQKQEW